MTNAQFRSMCLAAFAEFQKLVPKDTGNMAYNASKIRFPSPDVCEIYVDPDIAPYLPYTNEPWVAERWHGKKNPNEEWFGKAAAYIAAFVAKNTKGVVVHDSTENPDGKDK